MRYLNATKSHTYALLRIKRNYLLKNSNHEHIYGLVGKIMRKIENVPAANVYERRTGQTFTPLLEGKIQYGKLLMAHNIDAVRAKVTARYFALLPTTN